MVRHFGLVIAFAEQAFRKLACYVCARTSRTLGAAELVETVCQRDPRVLCVKLALRRTRRNAKKRPRDDCISNYEKGRRGFWTKGVFAPLCESGPGLGAWAMPRWAGS